MVLALARNSPQNQNIFTAINGLDHSDKMVDSSADKASMDKCIEIEQIILKLGKYGKTEKRGDF